MSCLPIIIKDAKEEEKVVVFWDSKEEYNEFISEIFRFKHHSFFKNFPEMIKQDIKDFESGKNISSVEQLIQYLNKSIYQLSENHLKPGKLDISSIVNVKKLSHVDFNILKEAFIKLNYNKNSDRSAKLKLAITLIQRNMLFAELNKFVDNHIDVIPNFKILIDSRIEDVNWIEKTLKSKKLLYRRDFITYMLNNISDNMLMLMLGVNHDPFAKEIIEERLESIGKKAKEKKEKKKK